MRDDAIDVPRDVRESREFDRRKGVARPLLWMAHAPGLRFDGDRVTFDIGANKPKRGEHSKYLKRGSKTLKHQCGSKLRRPFRELLVDVPLAVYRTVVFAERVIELNTGPHSGSKVSVANEF